MTKRERIFGTLVNHNNADVAFLANVIVTQHSQPSRKLAGLYNLVNAGHECRTTQFSTDALVVDGTRQPWTYLEDAAKLR